jgi:hypothetical protein
MSDNFNALLVKLDEFTRKFYKNQLLRGSLIFLSVILIAFLTCLFTDFFARLSTAGRTFLFFSFTGLTLFSLGVLIIIPLTKLYKLGKIISHQQAATIIGQHFPQVNDKIINTLQLQESPEVSGTQKELILASINQKINELKPVAFTSAIDLRENRRYLKYALPPVGVLLLLTLVRPEIVTDGTKRIYNYDSEYKPVAPFQFVVLNNELVTAEKADFTIQLKFTGESLPNDASIIIGDITYRLTKTSKTNFEYTMHNVQGNTNFHFSAAGFTSNNYELKVLPRPTLLDFNIKLEYPKYLGKQDITVNKTGDLNIPEGTRVTWNISTKNTEKLKFLLGDSTYNLVPLENGFSQFRFKARSSQRYSFMAFNNKVKIHDSLGYFINVIPDQYPQISVEETVDSVQVRNRYFMGQVSDDYGLSNLKFYYKYIPDSMKNSGRDFELKDMSVSFAKAGTSSKFIHYWAMDGLNLNPGDQVEYFFVVWDNDGVNGPKSARSQTKVFRVPTVDEINEQTEKNNSEIKDQMEAAIKDAQKLQKEFDNFQKDMLNKKNMDWQQKNKADELLQKQIDLQKKVEQLQNLNQQNNEQKSEFTQPDPELLEKQQMLDELFEKLMTDDMKKMLEEIQKMMENADKKSIQDQMEKMEMNNKEMEKELDRSLELFKQLELEQKVENLTDKLDELAQKEEKLAEKSKDKNANSEELKKEQEDIKKQFEEAKKDMEEMQKLNEELEEPMDMPDMKEDQNAIDKEMQDSKSNLDNNKNKKASENQKSASEKMQQMSDKMQKAMQSAQEKQNEEDMQALRQLLENIITLSFDQESLMNDFTVTAAKDPKYVKLGQKQHKLKQDARKVEDSLFALSKRVVQLKTYVNQEIGKVNENMDQALKKIEERNTSLANKHQQFVMTSLNNLALLLDEALQQMQQQAQAQAQSKGSPKKGNKKSNCNKPGANPGNKPGEKPSMGQNGKGNKPSMKGMKEMQDQLSKQLAKMKKQMEEGKTPGMNGKGSGGLMPGMSEDLAKAAAKQQAIRQMLQQMGQELNKDGSGKGNELKQIAEEMEKNEEDLVNRQVTIETLKRQQDIMTRLLESEKAERERDQDNKRESKENKFEDFSNQKQFLEYKRKKEKEIELLRTVPPALTPYYKQKVNQYFNKVQ